MKADIISYIRNGINEESINLTLIQKELDDIRTRFPLDNIPNMKIEDWVTVGDKYCFINMIENKTTSIASGFLGFNRNRLFYQGKNDPKPLIIKAISGEKRFNGLNDEQIFSLYMKEIHEFITTFDVDNYQPEKYLYGANVIKAKLVMIYRPDCKVCGFTSKDHAVKLAKYLGINIDKADDSLGINIKINKYILECDPSLHSINTYILGRLIWNFYADHVLIKNDNNKYLVIDRKNDAKVNEEIDEATYPDEEELKPKPAPEPRQEQGAFKYPRNPAISKQALKNAKYLCECGSDHASFIRKSNGKNYTEPHHIIPMSAQGDFDIDLDCLPKIISLCSNCHNKLHYGADIDDMLFQIYEQRKEALSKFGINISFEELLSYYKRVD